MTVEHIDSTQQHIAEYLEHLLAEARKGDIKGMAICFFDAEGEWWMHRIGEGSTGGLYGAWGQMITESIVHKTIAEVHEMFGFDP